MPDMQMRFAPKYVNENKISTFFYYYYFHPTYCWVSETKAAGRSTQCLKWARNVMFCLSRLFLYRKQP